MTGPKRRLPDGAWTPEPGSLVDQVGRVIYYENRVLRGVRATFASEIPSILKLAEQHHWFDHGLVPTWQTDLATDEFPLILEHQRIPFVTVRGEWPVEALRRAALCLLDLSAVLSRCGYCLKDAHTWNLLFDGPTPRVTDFGSIRPIGELNWPAWLREFSKYFLAPLTILANGQTKLARALLAEHIVGVGSWLLDHAPEHLVWQGLDGLAPMPFEGEATFVRLQEIVSGLTFRHAVSEWTSYPQPASEDPVGLRSKDRQVADVLARLSFQTAIDFGANRGLHAFMCASQGADVLAADIDEACLDDMFLRSASQRSRVLPLYVDVVLPAGASGAFQTFAPASERLRCDLVLALALVHHVCLRWQFSPAAFARGVANFTRNAAVIEFIPAEDVHVAQWGATIPPGYSAEGMQEALLRLFARCTRLDTDPAPRCIFVCEGKL